METDSINGKMVACMLGSISLIKNMDSVYTLGQMDASILDNGRIVNETAEVRLSLSMELKDKVSGKKIRDSDGLMNLKKCGTPRTQKNIDL